MDHISAMFGPLIQNPFSRQKEENSSDSPKTVSKELNQPKNPPQEIIQPKNNVNEVKKTENKIENIKTTENIKKTEKIHQTPLEIRRTLLESCEIQVLQLRKCKLQNIEKDWRTNCKQKALNLAHCGSRKFCPTEHINLQDKCKDQNSKSCKLALFELDECLHIHGIPKISSKQ